MKNGKTRGIVRRCRECTSQAVAEFALILPMMLFLMCAVFDYGLMISNAQTLAVAVREGANTASRAKATNALALGLLATIRAAEPAIDLDSSLGAVIATEITGSTNNANVAVLADQDNPANSVLSTGELFGSSDSVKNRSAMLQGGTWTEPQRVPPFQGRFLPSSVKLYVMEAFYTNQFVTPVGVLIGIVAPDYLYDAAYF